jgi:microcystin-dependent protein
MSQSIYNIVADFETNFGAPVAAGAVSAALATANDQDGNAIPTGLYCLTVDLGNSIKEYVVCTITGTAITNVQNISRQGALSTGFKYAHRRGAIVAITDWATILKLSQQLAGTAQLDGTSPIGYDSAPVSLTGNQLATVSYVLSVVTGGTVNFSQQTLAGQTAGETVAIGAHVYLNTAGNWYNVNINNSATYLGVKRGIALTGAAASSTFTVIISGPAPLYTGLTAGTEYYAGATNGSISSTANVAGVGQAISSTSILFDPLAQTAVTPSGAAFVNATTAMISMFAGFVAPVGFVLCDGAAYLRSTYPVLFAAIVKQAVFTVTLASPGVFTSTNHGLVAGNRIYLTTTGVLPSGLTTGVGYYVISAGLGASTFELSLSPNGTAINTSGSQSGVHTFAFAPHGAGDGVTTFNVPDLRDRSVIGAGTGVKTATIVSVASNVITASGLSANANNEFQTGEAVVFNATTAGNLTNGTTYYVIRTGINTFSLAGSLASAQTPSVITLAGTEAGSFTLTLTPRLLGETGGEENHAMSSTELLSHNHSYQAPNSSGSNFSQASGGGATTSGNINSTGGNAPMNIMSPFAVMNYIIKT